MATPPVVHANNSVPRNEENNNNTSPKVALLPSKLPPENDEGKEEAEQRKDKDKNKDKDEEAEQRKDKDKNKDKDEETWRQKLKVVSVHLSLWLGMVVYTLGTALVLYLVENMTSQPEANTNGTDVDLLVEASMNGTEDFESNKTSVGLMGATPDDPLPWHWTYLGSVRFIFSIITLIGTSTVLPSTTGGHIVSLLSGIFGIPFTVLAVADFGKIVLEGILRCYRTLMWAVMRCCRGRTTTLKEKMRDAEKSNTPLLLYFVFYLILTMFLIGPFLDGTPSERLLKSFIAVTGLGLGDVVLDRKEFSYFIFIYAIMGLAVITMSIEAAADVFKKVHYFGRKLADAGSTIIWFGGRAMTVAQLLNTVEDQYNISLHNLDLDKIVKEKLDTLESPGHSPNPPLEKPLMPEDFLMARLMANQWAHMGEQTDNVPINDDKELEKPAEEDLVFGFADDMSQYSGETKWEMTEI